MEKILVFVGMTIGSWLGWVIGARIGFFTAFMLSIVGTALGIYAGRRVIQEYF